MALLENKICVITGGCGSVGLATARLFLSEGAHVLLVDINSDALSAAEAELGSANLGIFVGDVSVSVVVEAYCAAAVNRWGSIDVVFSNAGNFGSIGPLDTYDEEAFDLTYRVHVKSAFLACKYAPRQMNDGGSIIITGSLAGLKGGAGAELNIAYVMAKHAQIGVIRSAARSLAKRRIRVNSLNPGPVQNTFQMGIEDKLTALTGKNVTEALNQEIPLHRHAEPAEVAKAALYLASDMSSYVTGHCHVVDGGLGS